MADKGGVLGIYLMPFLGYEGTLYPNLEMLLDHIDHAIRLCGVEHVGIGSVEKAELLQEDEGLSVFLRYLKSQFRSYIWEDLPCSTSELFRQCFFLFY